MRLSIRKVNGVSTGISCVLIRALLLILFLNISFAFSTKGEDNKKKYPVLGKEPIEDIALIEDHNEALLHWAKMGIRDAVLINIDTHDDIKRIQPVKLKKLHTIFSKKNWVAMRNSDPPDNNLISAGNFIFAAAKLGMIKEVYWIIPFKYFSYPDADERLRIFLKSISFPDDDVKTFSINNGCFSGQTSRVPLSLCSIDSLPNLDKPVILSVDADFFPTMASVRSINLLGSVKLSFDALYKKTYKIQNAVVAYSVNGMYTRVFHRWVGDEIVNILENPDVLSRSELPELGLIRQNAEILRINSKPNDILNYLALFQDKYNEEPSILMYSAIAYNEIGKIDMSFEYAEKTCLIDRNYCFILPELGFKLLNDRKLDIAEKFFLRGYALNPDMNYMQINFALYLKKAGRYKEALKYFKIFRKWYDPYPVDFLIGEAYLLLGNDTSAFEYFNSGRIDLTSDPYAFFEGHWEEADAVRLAAKFYEENGYIQYAKELRENPKLKIVFEGQPVTSDK
jgi:tetratricopeptide (TPR) repeat protein